MGGPLRFADLEAVGRAAGLDLVGACGAEPFAEARADLEARGAAGLAGTMAFTYKNPARSTDPAATLPGVTAIIAGGCSYHRDPPPAPGDRGPVARVARYVWADDQDRLLAGLGAIVAHLVAAGHRACVVADQNHLVDRPVAVRAGLGWFGKHANVLVPGRGSWFLLGSVLTDAPIDGLPDAEPVPDGCGACAACIPACPTGAIVAPGVIDARRCLSWVLQDPGLPERSLRVAIGDRIYGCDDCQEACPPNRLEVRRAAPGGSGGSVPLGDPERSWVPVLDLLAAPDDALLARHGRWYIPRRDPTHLRRNALLVLGNVGEGTDPDVRAALTAALAHPDPIVRGAAVWSARRLGCDDLAMAASTDPDPLVRAELDGPVDGGAPA